MVQEDLTPREYAGVLAAGDQICEIATTLCARLNDPVRGTLSALIMATGKALAAVQAANPKRHDEYIRWAHDSIDTAREAFFPMAKSISDEVLRKGGAND